jgi:hypothetical protein
MRLLTPHRYAASGAPTPAIDSQRSAHKCTSPARALQLESDDEGPAPAPTPRAPAAVAADAAQAFIDMPGEDAKVVARVLDQTAARDPRATAAAVGAFTCCRTAAITAVACVAIIVFAVLRLAGMWQSISLSCGANKDKGEKAFATADVDDNFYLSYAEVVRWGELMYGEAWGGFRREQCFDAFNDQGLGMPHKWLKNFQSCCDAEGK